MKQTLLRNLLLLLNVLLLCASQCPDHKPFASDAGCVSDCSEPFYIRNKTCVFDCGVDFVDESRQCVLSCPNTYVYRETLKATGTDMFVEKKCIHACDNNEVNFNNECLKRCPKQLIHLTSDEYRCVSQCPPEQQYIQNMTVNDIEYKQCTNKCVAFVNNGVCVSRCPSQTVDLNYVCMESCPPKYVESGGHCFQECNELSLQLICKCPKDKPFIEDKVCITNCGIDTFSSDSSFCGEKCLNNITIANSRFIKKSECAEIQTTLNVQNLLDTKTGFDNEVQERMEEALRKPTRKGQTEEKDGLLKKKKEKLRIRG
ncbi:proprotein convertase subtilisin/kexin type 5-like [Mya arenaria]|uniref:proprotein convertase subtilisin/kexin type 5-like n=1 Tax=Mya arenaria TaxID=6604 RepID=UPI0022E427A8|nr:proprotein convertase subtilisin/kexin type 5-like [Mya arenaria]